jgi:hypothetical protein
MTSLATQEDVAALKAKITGSIDASRREIDKMKGASSGGISAGDVTAFAVVLLVKHMHG